MLESLREKISALCLLKVGRWKKLFQVTFFPSKKADRLKFQIISSLILDS